MIIKDLNDSALKEKYTIIYADPPWKYTQDKKSNNFRAVTSQYYNTMSTQDICNLPIKDISKKESICFMWATFPQIKEALKVMEAWGFEYKTVAFVWIKKCKKSNKNAWGMGFYTRSNAEICLLGISPKSKKQNLIKNHSVHQVVETIRREHSRKPDEIRDLIIKLCGDVSKIELFARQNVEKWDSWGNQIGE
jgi:N6-adenosine-specific RNA methylase IME4